MTHITVPDQMKVKPGASSEQLVLCDEAGNLFGTFTPMNRLTKQQRVAMSLPYHLRDSKVPIEELNRRLRDEPGIPHEDVMRKVRELL